MSVLLTGASGFVGAGVLGTLRERGVAVRPVVRAASSTAHMEDAVVVSDLDAAADWTAALHGVTAVIHCAARAHIMRDEALDPLAEYRRVNVAGTLRLAQQAAAAGVRRFVFISSIKVNGESTPLNKPFTADDAPAPEDAYGLSKAEAEAGLRQLAQETGMEVVIIRPVLVYGPGVKGNFKSLLHVVARGIPLPLGCARHNCRSLVALENLVDLIVLCTTHPKAANQAFLVSDGEDLSTAELLQRVAQAQGVNARLWPVPVMLLRLAAATLGKGAPAQRLLGSLQVDIGKTRELLGWNPPLTVAQGLQKAVEGNR